MAGVLGKKGGEEVFLEVGFPYEGAYTGEMPGLHVKSWDFISRKSLQLRGKSPADDSLSESDKQRKKPNDDTTPTPLQKGGGPNSARSCSNVGPQKPQIPTIATSPGALGGPECSSRT